MSDQKLVIADGHHRYETALNYRNERRKETAREQGVLQSADAHDATASSPSLASTASNSVLSAASGAAAAQIAAPEHVEGASASIATATAASPATGAADSAPSNDVAPPSESAPYEARMTTFDQHPQARGLTILLTPPRRRQHPRLLMEATVRR